jgi:Zn-dependent M28 family amino/carboxypeptidase
MKKLILIVITISAFWSCKDEKKERKLNIPSASKPKVFERVQRPSFDEQSAYNYLKKQVDFGPRVPGSQEHKACAEYLEKELTELGWETEVQKGTVTTFDNKTLPIYNITGRYKPKNVNRIMLFAHWDTRPFADRDESDKNKPIDGANDGASGVAVLLELARAISQDSIKPTIGIDIVFFDAEDYGQPSGTMALQTGETWCLGSQYWAKSLPKDFIKPKWGILLDMVGGKHAVFPKEGVSLRHNKELVDHVWYIGQKLGYGKYFVNDAIRGGITDDHVYVNRAGIPSIDIIHYYTAKGDFMAHHHRHSDNMDIIDPLTLKVVGETVLEVVYREK